MVALELIYSQYFEDSSCYTLSVYVIYFVVNLIDYCMCFIWAGIKELTLGKLFGTCWSGQTFWHKILLFKKCR